ncbi:ArsR/SmtB family transcription factor [Verrucomicrobiota bacterium]
MEDFVGIIKALADKNRIRALHALKDRELCVCQIIEFLGLAPSTVSKHMSILRQAKLVKGRKAGRWMHYRLPGRNAPAQVREAIGWVLCSISDNPQICRGEKRLEKILKTDPTELCRKQNGCV